MDDQLDFLDGAVFYNSCDHARRIYDNWLTVPGNPVYHFIYIPKKRGDLAKAFYREEIEKLAFYSDIKGKERIALIDEALIEYCDNFIRLDE